MNNQQQGNQSQDPIVLANNAYLQASEAINGLRGICIQLSQMIQQLQQQQAVQPDQAGKLSEYNAQK